MKGEKIWWKMDSRPGSGEFETLLWQTFFLAYFHLSPLLKHVRKVVDGFGKKVVIVLVYRHNMTFAVGVVLNPSTIYQLESKTTYTLPVQSCCAPPRLLSGEHVGLMTWWLLVRSPVEATSFWRNFASHLCRSM